MDVADIRLIVKNPDKAYVSNMLWLPKNGVRVSAVQEALQYWDVKNNQAVLVKFWDETNQHLIVPREFITPDQYKNFSFPFVSLTPRRFQRTNVGDQIQWRDEAQQKAWEALRSSIGGILNLACGKGKSVLALKKVSELNVPALIVVNDGLQFEHWKNEIERHLILPPGERVGEYQGQSLDWKRPITIATIQTLANHSKDGRLPPGFGEWFGVVFFDEVHHLAAPFFAISAPIVSGLRFGLTATADRLDQKQWVYNYHLGGVFYSDLSQDLIPAVYFQETDVVIDENNQEVRDKRGDINTSKLRSFLGSDQRSLQIREFCIREAFDAGRKILCLSHSKEMLYNLHDRFQGSALCVAETPQNERIPAVQSSRVAFAIAKLGIECLNDAALDALFILTPLSSPNDLQQMIGRVQRSYPNKKTPIVMIFDDINVEKLHGMLYGAKKYLRSQKMPYETLPIPHI
jgi:superfamily II DNA or RNA helicase